MRKIINNILIVFSLSLLLQGCNGFLDNKPKGMTIPSQYEDYEKLLNGITTTTDAQTFFLTDDIKLLGKEGTASDYIYLNHSDEDRNLYSFQPGQIYTSGSKDYTWNNAYDRIFTYNTVINDILKSGGSSENHKLRIRAEALIGRAMEYLYLVNIYGAQYDKATSSTDWGVPYITKADINQKYTRNTVADVYKFILADIEEALPNLSSITPYTTHPNKTAAYALLAKVYLCMNDYSKALENANAALKIQSGLLNLNDYEMKDGVTWGRVHLKGDESVQLPGIDNPEALYSRFSSSGLQASVCISDDLRALFKKDLSSGSKDLRKEYYFAEDQVNLGRTDYFPGECAFVLYSEDNIGITTVETMFIAAECEARVGSKDKAINYVNTVRDNRIENNVHFTASSADDALVKVLEEKRREFCVKGAYRYMDLKRLNKESKFMKTITHSADGQTWTLAPNDPKWIFPINEEIIDFNPDMPQNERK